ncbi:MAG: pentapeptide repeat-containing protein [Cyanobacteria bacterium P01_E01_bin.6]
MDAKQLLKSYAEGRRDFSGADLRGVDLAEASLVNINLYRADLTGARLEHADLRGANFLKADLTHANLTNANLTEANLRRAELTGAMLNGAVLNAARFSDVLMPHGIPPRSASGRSEMERLDTQRRKSQWAPLGKQSSQFRVPSLSDHRATSVPHRHRSHSSLESFQQPPSPTIAELPVPSLALLWAGYCCFGSILGIYDVPDILWFMVWVTALAWMLGESMAWFTPVLAAIAVMLGSGLSLWAFIFAVSVSFGLGAGLLLLGWSFPKALTDSLWIGGLVVIVINLSQWLFRGDMSGITVSGYFPLALLLVIGMGSTCIGAIAWLQMHTDGFRRQHIACTFGGCAALGLLCGGTLSSLLLPSLS